MKKILLINIIFYSYLSFSQDYTIKKPFIKAFTFISSKTYDELAHHEQSVVEHYKGSYIKQIHQFLYNEKAEIYSEDDNYINTDYGSIKKEDLDNLANTTTNYNTYNYNKIIALVTSCDFSYNNQKYSMGTKLDIERDIINANKDSLLSFFSVRLMSLEKKRTHIIELARKLLGKPFQWGGRTALEGGGFDCAGLVEIVYLASGISCERGVSRQYKNSKDINHSNDLKIGDLIFYIDTTIYNTPIHAMLYAGKNNEGKHTYIHSTPQSMKVIEEVYDGDEITNNCEVPNTNYKIKLRRPNILQD